MTNESYRLVSKADLHHFASLILDKKQQEAGYDYFSIPEHHLIVVELLTNTLDITRRFVTTQKGFKLFETLIKECK